MKEKDKNSSYDFIDDSFTIPEEILKMSPTELDKKIRELQIEIYGKVLIEP